MPAMRLALYTFGIFREPAEHPANDGFHARNDAALLQAERSAGFIARSGYDGDPGPESWGVQVWPRWYVERGDGWSPATLSLWRDVESIVAFAYHGIHGDAVRHGREWFRKGPWPPIVLWWVADHYRPDWREAVARHEHLADNGPSPYAFNFAHVFDADGRPTDIERTMVARLRQEGGAMSAP